MRKHTPAPWSIGGLDDEAVNYLWICSDKDGCHVCNVSKLDIRYEANAGLIAAAPAMYELLKRTAEQYECEECEGDCSMCQCYRGKAQELIARIEGKDGKP